MALRCGGAPGHVGVLRARRGDEVVPQGAKVQVLAQGEEVEGRDGGGLLIRRGTGRGTRELSTRKFPSRKGREALGGRLVPSYLREGEQGDVEGEVIGQPEAGETLGAGLLHCHVKCKVREVRGGVHPGTRTSDSDYRKIPWV